MARILIALALAVTAAAGASAQVKLYGSLINYYDVQPGGSYTGEIGLFNETDAPAQVRVFHADFQYHADEDLFYEPGEVERSNSRWVSFSPDYVVVEPMTLERVSFSVDVPSDAVGEGSYWSAVVVEVIPASDPEYVDQPEAEGEVRASMNFRVQYGVQFVTTFGRSGEESLRVAEAHVFDGENPDSGEPGRWLQADLVNSGSRSYRPDVYVELYDVAGEEAGRVDGLTHLMHPGSVVRQRIDLGGVPPGEYQAVLVVDTGDNLFGTQLDVRL